MSAEQRELMERVQRKDGASTSQSGYPHERTVAHRETRMAATAHACAAIPDQRLVAVRDADGNGRGVLKRAIAE